MVAGKFTLEIQPQALKSLSKLDRKLKSRIEAALLLLSNDPRPPAAKKLANSDYYRIRVSDYRILYRIDDGRLIILIIQVGHRREIYRQLENE